MVVCLAACGGGSKKATTSTHTTTASTTPTTATQTASGGAEVMTGPVRATLHGADHTPVINKNWIYPVTVTDAAGHPLAGTVVSQFAFAGQVVGRETPPIHTLKDGHLRDVIVFPPRSLGVPLTFQTVIRTRLGSVTLAWPVKARR